MSHMNDVSLAFQSHHVKITHFIQIHHGNLTKQQQKIPHLRTGFR